MSRKCPKTVSVEPGIEPGTARIRLPDRSEDHPIVLIPPQERSLGLSYVSKGEKKTSIEDFITPLKGIEVRVPPGWVGGVADTNLAGPRVDWATRGATCCGYPWQRQGFRAA